MFPFTEPPTSVVVLDAVLQQLSIVAGPLEESNDLILTCKAYGGCNQLFKKRTATSIVKVFVYVECY